MELTVESPRIAAMYPYFIVKFIDLIKRQNLLLCIRAKKPYLPAFLGGKMHPRAKKTFYECTWTCPVVENLLKDFSILWLLEIWVSCVDFHSLRCCAKVLGTYFFSTNFVRNFLFWTLHRWVSAKTFPNISKKKKKVYIWKTFICQ